MTLGDVQADHAPERFVRERCSPARTSRSWLCRRSVRDLDVQQAASWRRMAPERRMSWERATLPRACPSSAIAVCTSRAPTAASSDRCGRTRTSAAESPACSNARTTLSRRARVRSPLGAPCASGSQSSTVSSSASLMPSRVTNGWSGVVSTRRPIFVRTSSTSPWYARRVKTSTARNSGPSPSGRHASTSSSSPGSTSS